MRVLLTKDSKNKLLNHLKQINNSKTNKELISKLSITKPKLDQWFYHEETYLPSDIIPRNMKSALEIIDEQEDNWGQKKGGKETYKILVNKYGKEEIKKRQVKGGINSTKKRDEKAQEDLKVDINSPKFLELYGALLGDGWLSALSYEYKKGIWIIGISGHSTLDHQYLVHLSGIIKELFGKQPKAKYHKNTNGMEIIIHHKQLVKFLNEKLNFPIGLKKDLQIQETIANDWEKIKPVIRGLFDTDGCFYYDKTPSGNPYPCISIHMIAPRLLKQVHDQLRANGYKSMLSSERITLKGSIQINKWMTEIGSNNQKHIAKYQKFNAPAA